MIQQIKNRSNGTGAESWSERTRTLQPKTAGCEVSRSVCPYCAVGCGQLLFHKEGKLVSVEGDPASPISRGHLCPKVARSGLLVQLAGILSGPIPITFRVASLFVKDKKRMRQLAALSGIVGSILMRYGWVRAGTVSARDWKIPLQIDVREKAPRLSR